MHKLLRRIEKYMVRKDMTDSRFGRDACNDANFVFQLRNGRKLGRRTIRRVVGYLRENP